MEEENKDKSEENEGKDEEKKEEEKPGLEDVVKIKVPKVKVPKMPKANLTNLRKNPWIASTFILIVLAIVLVVNGTGNSGGITGNVISDQDAGEIILDLAKAQAGDAEIVKINSENGLYEVILLIDGEEVPVYITKDGKNLVSLTPLSLLTNEPQQTLGEYSEEDLEKISVFIDCLAEKGVKIYGANWCGWTKKFVVETLGGFDIVAPIYVECTENEELCSQKVETGYPTTRINGELYTGPRTIEGLSEATECSAPEITVQSNNPSQEASCD